MASAARRTSSAVTASAVRGRLACIGHRRGLYRYPARPCPSPHFSSLTVFFPMWNEEEYIDRAVGAAREAVRALIAAGEIGDYELLIVDDASTDATGRLADDMAAADRRVRVVHHPMNRKLGGSLKTGYAEATGDLVLYSDADLPFDMDELVKACRVMRHYEADIVSRVPLRPHRRGLRPRRLLGDLQRPRPRALRRPHARHQLRLQADAAARSSTTSRWRARARSSTPS